MKHLFKAAFSFTFSIITMCSFGQKNDTLTITPNNINKKGIKYGKLTYVVYFKKTKESPSEGIFLTKINVELKTYNNKPVIAITQQWDKGDTVSHSSYTVLSAHNFSTLLHETYWKKAGYSTKFDFEAKKVSFEGNVADSVKSKTIQDFNESFAKYNLNWHSDLVIFTLLPYKENRIFKINFFDPGFTKPSEEIYSVTGSDFLTTSSGNKIECWVLVIKYKSIVGYQKFWIAKKNNEVLKEEDFFNNSYRYKLKLEVSEKN